MTLDEFRSAYPAFDAVDDSEITAQLALFLLQYQGNYGTLADYVQGLFVAHQLTVFCVNDKAAPAQVVKSRSVDGLSWSYETSGGSDKAGVFASTKYGMEFHRLMSLFGLGPVMSGAHVGNL